MINDPHLSGLYMRAFIPHCWVRGSAGVLRGSAGLGSRLWTRFRPVPHVSRLGTSTYLQHAQVEKAQVHRKGLAQNGHTVPSVTIPLARPSHMARLASVQEVQFTHSDHGQGGKDYEQEMNSPATEKPAQWQEA